MKPAADIPALVTLTKTTQDLLIHLQSALTRSSTAAKPTSQPQPSPAVTSNNNLDPLEVLQATTTLLRSHTTTFSLLLLTPPFTPSAIMSKLGEVSSGALTGMVAAATSPVPAVGEEDALGEVMRAEVRAQVRRLLSAWGDVLALVLQIAERKAQESTKGSEKGKEKDEGLSESEKQNVLSATGVVWEACDSLLKVCQDGVVGLVVRKAEEWRSVLLDAVGELKEWGEDVAELADEVDYDYYGGGGSDEENYGYGYEDDIFGAANKIGKGDVELKELLDTSVKRLKMVGMLYQALIKRRLKTFPKTSSSSAPASAQNTPGTDTTQSSMERLDQLLTTLKSIPDSVDDLASAFYDLDEDEAKKTLDICCGKAKRAITIVKQTWTGQDDEFTTWSGKWVEALEAAR